MARPQVVYTRHARGRMRLYGITTNQVELVLSEPDYAPEREGDRFVVLKLIPAAFKGMPLKVTYVIESGRTIVLSAYPLKRSYRR